MEDGNTLQNCSIQDDPTSYALTPESEGSEVYNLVIASSAQITLSGNGRKFNNFVAENAQNVSITLDNFTTDRPTQAAPSMPTPSTEFADRALL